MSDAYDEGLRALAYSVAQKHKYTDFIHARGTYAHVSGPSYETGAESSFLMSIGGDSVGMSTVCWYSLIYYV